jgi:hypothetical protein
MVDEEVSANIKCTDDEVHVSSLPEQSRRTNIKPPIKEIQSVLEGSTRIEEMTCFHRIINYIFAMN